MHIPFLLFVVAVSAPSGATLIDNGAIAIEARTDLQEAILPGEPVSVQFLVRNHKKAGDTHSTLLIELEFVPENFRICILDKHGQIVLNSNHIEWFPADTKYFKSMAVPSGGSANAQVVLNEYCSTDLPCGEYCLQMEFHTIGYAWLDPAPDIKSDANVFNGFSEKGHSVSKEVVVQQPILVLPADGAALNKKFSEMVDQVSRTLDHAGNGSSAEGRKFRLFVDKIAYAQTPVALPYQVRLYSGELIQYRDNVLNRSHFIAFMRYIMNHPTVEVIDGVRQLLENPQKESQAYLKKSGAGDFFLWALFRVYERGSQEMRALLEPYVTKTPRPREPVRNRYLD